MVSARAPVRELRSGTMPEPESPLSEYRGKRSANRTPEPSGARPAGSGLRSGGLFVVQKHAARRTHYDLRLELDGVLKSWAVPRGFSLDPTEKRLAVETEDHPFEYGDFEGVIPDGNYGAGAMIVWDRGVWLPLEEPHQGMEKGKLLFELRGYKLRGVYTMFRTKPALIHRGKNKDEDKQWLLMKKPDEAARAGEPGFSEVSVLSGLSVEELAQGPELIAQITAQVAALGKPERRIDSKTVSLMLATPTERPFSDPRFLFELKYDGYRMLAAADAGRVTLRYRNGYDATPLYPEIVRALAAQPAAHLLVDGEVVVLEGDGRPSFNRLQRRALLSRATDIERAALEHPATYVGFVLLAFGGYDLRGLALSQRKELLRQLVPAVGPVRFCDHIPERGEDFYREIERIGLEGMVAKKADSRYLGRRSSDWQKIALDRAADFVIVGFTAPDGIRSGFGALHLASYEENDEAGTAAGIEAHLLYRGRVGSGFDQHQLGALSERLRARPRLTPPCHGELPGGAGHLWVEPELCALVRYKDWTPQGMLRHPVFLRLREDKTPQECTRPSAATAGDEEPPAPPAEEAAKPRLAFSNLDKVFWPEHGYTKGDLSEFYRKIAPAMLPYLRDRPLVLTRYPDGIHGKSYLQKNAPDFAPDWIRTETIWSEGSERDIDYFICNEAETLVYLANLGAIVLHVWSSRLATLAQPDWCILDLDPKEAPFDHVVEVALAIRALCSEIGLPSYVKSSGSSGLHVLLPLGRSCTYEQSRTLAQLIAQWIARERRDIATVARNLERRDGKVYLDFVQNGHGRLLVAPYSVRPLSGAPVSCPLLWDEVRPGLDIRAFTIENVPERAAAMADPLLPVLDQRPDLLPALERLAAQFSP